MKTLDLTIVILTHRADNVFLKALSSAQVAQQVLIIDHASGNDWKKLRTEFAFEILNTIDSIQNFSRVRNDALKYVQTKWVLFLDSDEELPKKSYSHLDQLLKTEQHGYFFKRKDVFIGKPLQHGETAHTPQLRLFQKNHAQFIGAVHERCVIEGDVGHADIELLHYSHDSITTFFSKVSRYSLLQAQTTADSKGVLLVKLLVFPTAKFIKNYIVHLGFLDGIRGFIYALMMSLHSFFVRVHCYEKKHTT